MDDEHLSPNAFCHRAALNGEKSSIGCSKDARQCIDYTGEILREQICKIFLINYSDSYILKNEHSISKRKGKLKIGGVLAKDNGTAKISTFVLDSSFLTVQLKLASLSIVQNLMWRHGHEARSAINELN